MKGLTLPKTPLTSSSSSSARPPLLPLVPCFAGISRKVISSSLRCREISKLNRFDTFRAQASNVTIGSGGYEEEEQDNKKSFSGGPPGDNLPEIIKPPSKIPYPLSIAIVLLGCALVFSLVAFVRGGPSSILAAIAKSGLAAAFTLIFVSEIGDKVTSLQF
ncbi:hypothetical protein NC653_009519 [Populus alba x Populus x berolinensis]|uniref:GDT1 family protein n=1 Tax=Populus alba x Populus x berolinensis TaxID=444605 RepID=A0AAD6R9L3_9ROSI|nr:hypothetical protein NC653_009519 [Populus alba x Populus x berolinensis]